MALGSENLVASGALVELFSDWPGETFPLHAYHPSRHQPPAKTKALIDFCHQLAVDTGSADEWKLPPPRKAPGGIAKRR